MTSSGGVEGSSLGGVEGSSSSSLSSLGSLSWTGDGGCVSIYADVLTTSWLSASTRGSCTEAGTA